MLNKHLGAAALALAVAAAVGGSRSVCAEGPPPRPDQLYENAAGQRAALKWADAAAAFTQAADAFSKTTKPGEISTDKEWELRARLDAAEALLRAAKSADAEALAAQVLADPAAAKSASLDRARYVAGHAAFSAGAYTRAGRALVPLAPFDVQKSPYAHQARYLLARVHQLSGESPEAIEQFAAVVRDWPAARKFYEATPALRPLARETPEYVHRSQLYQGQLLARAGKNAAAQDLFAKLKTIPGVPAAVLAEARLWHGICQMQVRNYREAEALFKEILAHPVMGLEARWFSARARALGADPGSQTYVQTVSEAAQSMVAVATALVQKSKTPDADTLLRQADILLDAGDTYALAKRFDLAAKFYGQVAEDFRTTAPDRAEQALERAVAALHLNGSPANPAAWDASDAIARTFHDRYPTSTLRGGVLFRQAETAYLRALAVAAPPAGQASGPAPAARDAELALLEKAAAHYARVIEECPDFPLVSTARAGLAACAYLRGDFAKAAAALALIPESDRTGELAAIGYMLGDCLLRALPERADDALSAAEVLEEGARAAKLFVTFAAANERHPQFADALLKAALCHQRLASVLADPLERRKNLTAAREMLDRAAAALSQKRSSSPRDLADQALAVIERGKVHALLGDPAAAINDLRGFLRNEKLNTLPDAPLAVLRLASLLRAAGKPAEAVELLAQQRPKHEPRLARDPARASWAAALANEHASALREAGRVPEARALFDVVARQYAGSEDGARAAWRAAQCRREEILVRITDARAALAAALSRAAGPDADAARARLAAALVEMRGLIDAASSQSAALSAVLPEAGARMAYQAAWAARALADDEIDAVRTVMKAAMVKRHGDKLDPRHIDVPLDLIPVQAAEWTVRDLYQRAIAAAGETGLGVTARFELAELLAARNEIDPAIELLADALALGPDEEVSDRIRVRIAGCLVTRGALPAATPETASASAAAALIYAKTVLKNNRSGVRGQAFYVGGEAALVLGDLPAAIEALTAVRDNPAFANIPGVSDKALFRLAAAFQLQNRPDDARAALEQMINRFPNSPFTDAARFELASLHARQKRLDAALVQFNEVAKRPWTQLGAKACVQAGLIRIDQKNYKDAVASLLAVGRSADDPAVVDETRKLLARVVKDSPNTPWSGEAARRLSEMQ